jgi:hypothetical protein
MTLQRRDGSCSQRAHDIHVKSGVLKLLLSLTHFCAQVDKVFQAYDEGSIPFTRSNLLEGLLMAPKV